MKFSEYIEESIIEKISSLEMVNKNCKQYLRILKSCAPNSQLYRGIGTDINIIKKFTPRIDRKPMDTKLYTHNKFNEKFYKKFAWRPRSEGVFVTSNYTTAAGYAEQIDGKTYAFFPLDKFKYIWNPKIIDFFVMTRNFYPGENPKENKVTDSVLNKFRFEMDAILSMLGKHEYRNYLQQTDSTYEISEIVADAIVETYINTNLCHAIDFGNEIAFKCDAYYLVNK